jgi:Na+-transporting NADH:ubiquinone oxidoreductase subunit A
MAEESHIADAQETTSPGTRPIRIVKGLDVPISGAPEQIISDGPEIKSVALLGGDYIGMRPQMRVEIGDRVKLGQALFADRRLPEILYTSPGSGVVTEINRGARRALLSVVVKLSGDEAENFSAWPADQLADLRRDQVSDTLLASGLWTALRTRPHGKIPAPGTTPSSIFVTAMDSNPLAAKAKIVIDECPEDFANGLTVLSRLTDGPVFVCQDPMAKLPTGAAENISAVEFSGPHPSGLAGTHIHHLDPVGGEKTVWHIGCQDIIAIGRLFTTGKLDPRRVVALAGPLVTRPRLVRARLGASTDDLTAGELHDADRRIVSGSVLSGRRARGPEGYLGRFHNQISVLEEGPARQKKNAFTIYSLSSGGRQKRALTTDRHGGTTALLPLGGFERVMPLDILPTQLLRALLVGDTDMAQALGCLELDEEDLALCGFVCPSKIDNGPLLRQCLARIEKEG